MEVLTAGAAKALGSFWGGVAAVAKTGWSMGNVLSHKVRIWPLWCHRLRCGAYGAVAMAYHEM